KGVQLEKEITLLLKMITFNYIKKGEFSLSYMLSYYVSEVTLSLEVNQGIESSLWPQLVKVTNQNYIELLSIGPKFLQ
ncbi:1258_t:CDS:2, partial [Entrophospora sp. SA101]